jgi:hypothetical protein
VLSLRPPQLEALDQVRLVDLEQRLRAHVCRCFPAATRGMSDAELLELIRHGVDRARAHGIDTERGACKLLNLMFVFGRDFDRELPWAREILDGARVHRGLSTIELLYLEGSRREGSKRGLHGDVTHER